MPRSMTLYGLDAAVSLVPQLGTLCIKESVWTSLQRIFQR